jgi:heavy metal sensor kinase
VNHRLGLRSRITLWYLAVMCAAIAVYAAGIFVVLERHVYLSLDRHLAMDMENVLERIDIDPISGGVGWTRAALTSAVTPEAGSGQWVEVWSEDGRLVLKSASLADSTLGPAPQRGVDEQAPVSGAFVHGPVRSLTRAIRLGERWLLVRVATSEIPERRELANLLLGLGLVFPVTALVAGAGGMLLARRALSPLVRMAERAHRLSAERLGERMPVEDPDEELGDLGRAFNDALARLDSSFDRMRRFSADVSHELRTPLTALRTVGEVGLQRSKSSEAYQEVIGSMLEEADRLTRLVESLLQLSRADAGELQLAPEWVTCCDLACEVATHLAVLAEDRGQTLAVDAAVRRCVLVDRMVFRQALVNLVDNAIKYSPPNSTLRIGAQLVEDGIFFEVADQGPGIAVEHQTRVFDRFYRVDPGRSRDRGGHGLGLAFVKWAAEAHAGSVELHSRLGEGSRFRIKLPLARVRTLEECGCEDHCCEPARIRPNISGCP